MSMEFQDTNRLMPTDPRYQAVTGASVAVPIPEGWAGAFVTLQAIGGTVLFKPGDASVEVDKTFADPTKIGWQLTAGAQDDWRIPPGLGFLAIVTPSPGTVYLLWALTSDKSQPRGVT